MICGLSLLLLLLLLLLPLLLLLLLLLAPVLLPALNLEEEAEDATEAVEAAAVAVEVDPTSTSLFLVEDPVATGERTSPLLLLLLLLVQTVKNGLGIPKRARSIGALLEVKRSVSSMVVVVVEQDDDPKKRSSREFVAMERDETVNRSGKVDETAPITRLFEDAAKAAEHEEGVILEELNLLL